MSAVDTLVEPVAWRVRAYPGHTWQIVERILPHFPQDWEKQPLVPASALEASEAKIAALTAENATLGEALKPFAKFVDALDLIAAGKPGEKPTRDDHPLSVTWGIKGSGKDAAILIGDLRRARAALRREGKP